MSELKAFVARKIYAGSCDPVPCIEVYSKSEVDKVIAELEMKLAIAQQVLRFNKPEALYSNLETMSRLTHEKYVIERRERHQKYKRCLAMADYAMYHHFRMLYIYGKSLDDDKAVFKINYGLRWRSRWLALAGQFTDKEAK